MNDKNEYINQLAIELNKAKLEIIELKFKHEIKNTDKDVIKYEYKETKNPFMCFKTKITAEWAEKISSRFGYDFLVVFLDWITRENEEVREEKTNE